MTTTTVLKFMQKTAEDQALRQRLEQLLGVGDGNISSTAELDAEESAAINLQAPHVAEFAAQQGFLFSQDELLTVVNAFRQYQEGQLSDEEFAQIAGMEPEQVAQLPNKNNFQRVAGYLAKTYLGLELN